MSFASRSPKIQNRWLPREKEKEAKGKEKYFVGGRESAVRDSTLKFQSTIRRHQESLLQASSIRRVSTRGNGTEERGYGETIYPKFASSRSATGYTLICPRGNLSTATLLQRRFHHHHHHHYCYHHHLFVRPLQPRSTVPPFPAFPNVYGCLLLSRRRERETAKPHGNFKHRRLGSCALSSTSIFPLCSSSEPGFLSYRRSSRSSFCPFLR